LTPWELAVHACYHWLADKTYNISSAWLSGSALV